MFRLPRLIVLSAVLLLASACAESTDVPPQGPEDGPISPVSIIERPANDPEIPLPDFESAGELEQAVLLFGECVEESFPIVIRFRGDPFLGLYTEVGSQDAGDGDLVDSVTATCTRDLDLDRRLSAYQEDSPLSLADEERLVDEFEACAAGLSELANEAVVEAELDSYESIVQLEVELFEIPGLSNDDLIGISDCARSLVGPERIFADGHEWFETEQATRPEATTTAQITETTSAFFVSVKYRDTPVNLASGRFTYLSTEESSLVRGAWYDASNEYLVIALDGIYYHYCGLPTHVWVAFQDAGSFGAFYNSRLKGNYDCRLGHVPSYSN